MGDQYLRACERAVVGKWPRSAYILASIERYEPQSLVKVYLYAEANLEFMYMLSIALTESRGDLESPCIFYPNARYESSVASRLWFLRESRCI